jgi:hypothetical protein
MRVRRVAGRTALVIVTAVVCVAATAAATATFQDTAAIRGTGKSGPRAKIVDLSIASWDAQGTHACGTFNKGTLATQVINIADYNIGNPLTLSTNYICLRNQGARPTDALTLEAANVQSIDTACTNDEASFDTTCGTDQPGELQTVLKTVMEQISCDFTSSLIAQTWPFTGAGTFAGLGANDTRCYRVNTILNTPLATESELQAAQSDDLVFEYRFTDTLTA